MVKKYLSNIATIYKTNDYLEHSFRTDFENLLNEIKNDSSISVLHEPQREKGFGSPDFKITDKSGAVIGYIECKNINENINELVESEQIKKYLQVSNNLILTNYIDFIYFKNGEIIESFSITNIFNLTKNIKVENEDKFNETIKRFLLNSPKKITNTKELSYSLASRTKILHDLILESVIETESNNTQRYDDVKNNNEGIIYTNHFYSVYKTAFKPIDEKLSIEDFCDMYAQILSFGFLFYKLSFKEKIDIKNIGYDMPSYVHIPLLTDIFNHTQFNKWGYHIKWIIDEIIVLLNNIDVDSINEKLSYKNKSILSIRVENMEDPFLFFYEEFLSVYNKKLKVDRGVFYTPEAVVSFIIRSIDELLISSLKIEKSFLDTNIKILDFAAGTGTFILALIEQIYNKLVETKNAGLFQKEISDFILKNIFGFEFLAVPYIICHLRIQEYLDAFNFKYKQEERAQVYLTNTLEKKYDTKETALLQSIADEMKEANRIKSKEEILVIMGNPPYNVSSQNKDIFIEDLMKSYKVDVKGEKNIQPLSNDYVKFIRFAHYKIENNKKGIIGIITANSYLDGVIFRGMRKELYSSFDEIYILDLKGDSKIGDKCEDGSKDENVFDIQTGVSIAFFVKTCRSEKEKKCKVYYKNLQGLRKDKYNFLYSSSIENINWEELKTEKPDYWFVKKDFSNSGEYETYFKIDEIFENYNSGAETGNDEELVYFTAKNTDNEKKYNYRIFDMRYINYEIKKLRRATFGVMKHFINKENIGLILRRTAENTRTWQQVFVSNDIIDGNYLSARTHFFPLYIYDNSAYKDEEFTKKTNFTDKFTKYLKEIKLDNETPEDIFAFIYASLHSPNYRKKYYEFLKINFPRINFEVEKDKFNKLVNIGKKLIDLHTLKTSFKNSTVNFPCQEPDYKVSKVKREGIKIYINDTTYFSNVSDQVYNFYIGGYQVLDKWLKERKKHSITLSLNDINHFIKICDVIENTITLMTDIDKP